jgi:hypothetical protein
MEVRMKSLMLVLAAGLAFHTAAGEIIVQHIHGDVSVRHGVAEGWSKVASGDVLRPDDTMKTGEKGAAVLVASTPAGKKTIALPPDVIVDMSDIRDLSPEDLMLKLTMEKVRASSYQWKNEDLQIPHAAVMHGADQAPASLHEGDPAVGILQFNGVHVLFTNGFYATCALKGMEILRRYPSLESGFDNRFLVAEALEKADLRGEARNEYGTMTAMTGLTPAQQEQIRARIEALRK